MTESQIDLVQSTWAKVVPIADTAATLFYNKLFELDPSLMSMFPSEMADQKKKLMQTIGVAVNGLKDLDRIVPVVQELGVRHVGYGVMDAHYDTVGAALLWTLGQGLGDAFTPEVKTAWTETYMLLAGTMKDAAAKAA